MQHSSQWHIAQTSEQICNSIHRTSYRLIYSLSLLRLSIHNGYRDDTIHVLFVCLRDITDHSSPIFHQICSLQSDSDLAQNVTLRFRPVWGHFDLQSSGNDPQWQNWSWQFSTKIITAYQIATREVSRNLQIWYNHVIDESWHLLNAQDRCLNIVKFHP